MQGSGEICYDIWLETVAVTKKKTKKQEAELEVEMLRFLFRVTRMDKIRNVYNQRDSSGAVWRQG